MWLPTSPRINSISACRRPLEWLSSNGEGVNYDVMYVSGVNSTIGKEVRGEGDSLSLY